MDGLIKQQTNTIEAILLFQPYRDCQIGVATGKGSGITVIDIDVKNGKNGFLTLESFKYYYSRNTDSNNTHRRKT